MAKLSKSISIQAPVEQVFAYLTDPHNQVEIWPSIVEVSDVVRLPDGGYTHGWVYKMAGVHLTGSTRTLEFVPNQRFVEETKQAVVDIPDDHAPPITRTDAPRKSFRNAPVFIIALIDWR